ncbi:Heat shock factor protein [Frankliniella fusca]|uniref:Heat shock factor protein n=1 Tax=Frankliniella fusca TaxID=407009 RepID=A0AAE1LQD4_9NEOP|nr:Heat shock factor protein [Frankliniella fusca]
MLMDDLDLHVGTMDSDLGQLKDFLNNSGIQLDANTLLGLFNPDDSMMPDGDGSSFTSKMDAPGNELMYYQPDFMDLEEIWNEDNGRTSTPPASPIVPEVNTPLVMPVYLVPDLTLLLLIGACV